MKRNSWRAQVVQVNEVLWLAILYLVTGKLGVLLAIPPGVATPVWPASGVALAVILLKGYHLWPGVWIGSFCVNLPTLLQHPTGGAVATAVAVTGGIATGSTLQALLGAFLIRRWIGSRHPFDHSYDVLKFAVVEFVSCLVAATVGVTSLWLSGFTPMSKFAESWWTFWLGDVLGVLVVASLILAWSRRPAPPWTPARLLEGVILVSLLMLLGIVVSVGGFAPGVTQFPVAYLFFSFVVWSAVRFGLRGVTAAIVLMAFLAIMGTIYFGPMAGQTRNDSLVALQAFIGVMTLTGLFLAAALTESKGAEARFRLAVEAAPTGMLMVDEAGTIVLANSQMAKMFGYAIEELLGRPVEMLVPLPIREVHPKHRAAFFADPQSRAMGAGRDLYGRHRDGDEIPVEIGLNPLAVDNRLYVLASVIDITERKKVETEIERAKLAAEAANRAKGDFLANVSHEIRTPLNGVLGLIELLADTELAAKQREYVRLVQIAADSLLTVINDVLDFAKIDAGKLSLKPVPFRLRDCMHRTLKTLAPRAHKKGLEMTCLIQLEVPDALVGDYHRLCQVVLNLASNAIKFTDRGEVVVRVELVAGGSISGDSPSAVWLRAALIADQQSAQFAAPPPTTYLHFSVSDTGIGIPPDKRERIFQPFEQADTSARRRYEGTGLGLAIASQLCALMGGHIWLESAVGQGSTFHFTAQFGLGQAAENVSAVSLREIPILVVDGNVTSRRQLVEWLRQWNAKPTAVAGAAEAVTVLSQIPADSTCFALLLLDAHLPEIDGFTFMDQVRREKIWTGKTILLRRTTDGPEDAKRSADLGIDATLTKPLSAAELLDMVRRLLGRNERESRSRAPAAATLDGVAATSAQAPPPEPADMGFGTPAEQPARRTILVVEDNLISQHLLRDLLEKAGHSIAVASSGEEALAILERESFDVVLLDVQMPGMSGLEVSAHLRTKEKTTGGHLPIIALTAHAMHGDRERCIEAGMDDYVAKPIQMPELWAAIDHVLESRAMLTWPENKKKRPADKEAKEHGPTTALVAKMARLFIEICPQWQAALHQAVATGDARTVEVTAHTVRGSASHFAADAAMEAAMQLELMARNKDLKGADRALSALDSALQQLRERLENLAQSERAIVVQARD